MQRANALPPLRFPLSQEYLYNLAKAVRELDPDSKDEYLFRLAVRFSPLAFFLPSSRIPSPDRPNLTSFSFLPPCFLMLDRDLQRAVKELERIEAAADARPSSTPISAVLEEESRRETSRA
jgi:hypothetical protein